MARLRSLLTFAAMCGALAALPADARFGKHDSGESSGGRSSGGGSTQGSASAAPRAGNYHSASPNTGQPTSSRGYRSGGGADGGGSGWAYRPSRRAYWGRGYRSCWDSWWGCGGAGWGYQPLLLGPSVVASPAPLAEAEPGGPELAAVFTFSAQGQSFLNTGGGSLAGLATFEQGRFGLSTEFNALFVPAVDGSGAVDHLRLWNSYVTFAVLANERGRLRLGAGVDAAMAPDATFVGPGFVAQASVGLAGPIGLEGTVHLTPLPFTQVDWSAGATLALGPVGLRGGWRRIYLNDQGNLDGVIHEDVFSGPYVAVGLAL